MEVAELKAEIQRIAWTTDPEEKRKLAMLKLKLYRLHCGDMANWRYIQGDFEDGGGYDADLAPYHDIANTLSIEDSF